MSIDIVWLRERPQLFSGTLFPFFFGGCPAKKKWSSPKRVPFFFPGSLNNSEAVFVFSWQVEPSSEWNLWVPVSVQDGFQLFAPNSLATKRIDLLAFWCPLFGPGPWSFGQVSQSLSFGLVLYLKVSLRCRALSVTGESKF